MTLPRTLARVAPATLLVVSLSLGSSIVLARQLGATTATDAYYLAYSVAAFAYVVLMAAMRQGAIPALTNVAHDESRREFSATCSQILSAATTAATVLVVMVTVIAVCYLQVGAGGSAQFVTAARKYMIEMSPYAVSGAALGALSAILAVEGMFAVPTLVLGCEAVLKSALVLGIPGLGVQALVIGSLGGNLLAVFALWHVVRRRGVHLRLSPFRSSAIVRSVFRLAGPLAIGQTVLQVNPVIDRAAAAGLGAGNVTAFELGARVYAGPASVLAAILIAPLAATWSARLATDGWPAVRHSLSRVIMVVIVAVPPVAVAGFLVRHDLIALVYGSHAYSAVAVSRTSEVVGMLLLGLPAEVLIVPLATLFVIRSDTVLPMRVAFANAVLNAALDWALRGPFGVGGIATSTAVTYTVLCAVYFRAARRRWGSLELQRTIRPLVVSVTSCIAISASCIPLFGLSHLGRSRGEEVGAAVLVLALAVVIHGLMLTVGRVRPLIMSTDSSNQSRAPTVTTVGT